MFRLVEIFFLLAFAGVFFNFFCAVGNKCQKFLFSHFPDSEDEETRWTQFLYKVKIFFVLFFWFCVSTGLILLAFWSQYNLDMFEW